MNTLNVCSSQRIKHLYNSRVHADHQLRVVWIHKITQYSALHFIDWKPSPILILSCPFIENIGEVMWLSFSLGWAIPSWPLPLGRQQLFISLLRFINIPGMALNIQNSILYYKWMCSGIFMRHCCSEYFSCAPLQNAAACRGIVDQ